MPSLRREGFLNEEYRPCKGCNATQMAFIADSIASNLQYILPMEDIRQLLASATLRQLLGAKDLRGSKMEKEDIIIDLLKRATEADGEICGTDAYLYWLKSVQG